MHRPAGLRPSRLPPGEPAVPPGAVGARPLAAADADARIGLEPHRTGATDGADSRTPIGPLCTRSTGTCWTPSSPGTPNACSRSRRSTTVIWRSRSPRCRRTVRCWPGPGRRTDRRRLASASAAARRGDYALRMPSMRSWRSGPLSAAVVAPLTLAQFNAIAAAEAHALLGSCLDIERWVLEVDAGRPYPDWESLRARASASAEAITWDEVAGALARHPRIGETGQRRRRRCRAVGRPSSPGSARRMPRRWPPGTLAYEAAVRLHLPDLRDRAVRGADARRPARAADPRRSSGTARGDGRTAQDRGAAAGEGDRAMTDLPMTGVWGPRRSPGSAPTCWTPPSADRPGAFRRCWNTLRPMARRSRWAAG